VTVVTTVPKPQARRSILDALVDGWRNVVVLTRRNVVHIAREPFSLSDATVQPILFTLLFVCVFGSAVPLAGTGGYKEFALAGMILLNLTTSAAGTAVGLSSDLNTGVIDRFQTLPMWRAAVLVGRSISDVLQATLCASIVVLTGLAIGWRAQTSPLSVVGGLAVALCFAYSLSWGCACLGLATRDPESAQGMGLLITFPLAGISNAIVPTQGLHPAWLRAIADWNPVSVVTSACRELFGNPNPSFTIKIWPMEHPVWAALAWSVALMAVFAPLGAHLYRRRTIE